MHVKHDPITDNKRKLAMLENKFLSVPKMNNVTRRYEDKIK